MRYCHYLFVASVLFQIGARAQGAPADRTLPAFVGSQSCRECHQHFYRLWAPSHHGLALQPYTPDLGRTNLVEQKTAIPVGTSRFQADLKKGVMRESGPDGQKDYRIEDAMGGKNVFYFLTSLDRGRLQVLPLAFDVRRKAWFDTALSAVRHFGTQPDAPLDWHDSAYTFNTACFNCHVSQLSKNYDTKTDTYHTTWAEPGINCETCHGPGAEHIQAARAAPKDEALKDLKLIVTSTFRHDQMNSLCASCHAKMYPITGSFTPGEAFFDHFGLIGLEQADFYPDGRDLGENFTETTWRLSPCVESGQLDCIHCHTSSGRSRFAGENANRACLPCHEPQVQNVAQHSHHKDGSSGAQCIACHMPMTEFARMRRSDHSMRPPMPAATLAFGSPNACNSCHKDKDAAWADRTVRQWQPHDYQAPTLQRATWIAAARKHDWSKLSAITEYLASSQRQEIWAAALIQLIRPCPDERKWEGILPCLKDKSPLVRAAAADACSDGMRPEFLKLLVAATQDPVRLVRIRAAAALVAVPSQLLPTENRAAIDKATTELRQSLLARPDDWASHYNLGNFHMERHEFEKAITAFETAHKSQPASVPPLVNVSLAYNATGANDKAERDLHAALALEPTNAVVNLNLGMLLAELGKLDEAEKAFRTTFSSDPHSAQAA